jgi:hypothetical protein
MPSPSLFALSALAFAQLGYSLAFNGPQPTPAERIAADAGGFSPRPTEPPGGHHGELIKRAIALPRTCGWLWDAKVSSSMCDLRRTNRNTRLIRT